MKENRTNTCKCGALKSKQSKLCTACIQERKDLLKD